MEKLQKIYESKNTTIYKGYYQDFDNEVVVKILNTEYAYQEQIIRFNNEYEFLKDLEINGVRKVLKKDKKDGKNILILEYFEGKTLKFFLKNSDFEIKKILEITKQIAQSLAYVHNANIIHKDINSQNILLNSQNEIKIIDFGIASKIDLHTQDLGNPEHLEGTLEYISPEQTGRMNRIVDYRTDLYSLGITFYEMFTGKLPFISQDPMELVHAHITKMPIPPAEINANIPESLSDIVMKLLSKNAEDRYQSAHGLLYDLEYCQDTDFNLASKDFSGKFQIPQKLYGREDELKTLLQTYERISKGNKEMMLVAGYSGIGKSSLINEIHKPITEKRGVFISGKFDQFQQNIPYYVITQAFNQFCLQLLKESEEKLSQWRKEILLAVGSNGQILIEVIPNLELIIKKQIPVAVVGAQESQNRFNMVFQNFIKVISNKEHPLTLFIDDLQWVDYASLNLIQTLLNNQEISYFLLIGAYRDNEVDNTHIFTQTIKELKENQVIINTIRL